MRISYINLFIFYMILNQAACQVQPHASIGGNIRLAKDWKHMVYLIQPHHFSEIAADYLGQVIDSTMIKEDGSFSFHKIDIHSLKTFVEITVQKKGNRYPNHLTGDTPSEANYIPLVLSANDRLTISADISQFQLTWTMDRASQENKVMMLLRDTRNDAFNRFLMHKVEDDNDSLLLEKEKAYQQYANTLMHFADTTKCMVAALVSIRWISPTGDFERLPEFLFGQCGKWHKNFPENIFVKELCAAAEKNKLPVLIGDTIPDFSLPLTNGDTLMFSTLLGDSLTILDIWASWCAPCRKENRMVLAPLWGMYKDKGFQIIGYSIDASSNAWREGIAKDGAMWVQASHLHGDSSPFLEALRITTIPANFILDHDGKIIAKNLFGTELERFVKERMK